MSLLKTLSQRLQTGATSSVELAQDYLARIRASTLNAFITIDEEKTLAEAKVADVRRAQGEQAPLLGIPIAHKDIFCAQGWRTTCGSKMLENFVAPYDAHVISQFQRAGAVNLGKTNMDEFAMGSSNETSYFGAVKNPWDQTKVPGGSSGGSAAAVAARLCPAATATDTGGSIRQPASLCGVTGLKPTYGLVSRYGMIAFASSLDQAGPIATSAEDCALLLNVMVGFDARDSTSLQRESEDYSRYLHTPTSGKPLQGLRIGVPEEFFPKPIFNHVDANGNINIGALREKGLQAEAVAEYEKLGAEFVYLQLPNMHLSIPVYYVLAPAEASSNLSRYDGVRYGYRAAEYDDLMDMYCKTRAEGFGEEVKRRILIGTYVLSAGYYDAYYLQAQKIRRLIAEDFARAFTQCDVIMGPTTPGPAFALGDKINDPLTMYHQDLYTISTNLAGLPALSIPAGFDRGGLPVGLQIIANYFDEARLLNVAHQYQSITNWHQRLPPDESC